MEDNTPRYTFHIAFNVLVCLKNYNILYLVKKKKNEMILLQKFGDY